MAVTAEQVKTETRHFMQKVYAWMFLGLLISAGVAYYTAFNPALFKAIFQNKFLFWGLLIGEIALIFILFAVINKISAWLAVVLFIGYCVLTGLTLSVIFLIYTIDSIGMTFLIASAMFGSMSVYGFFTKSDLTGIGNILIMGLWGIIIASVVNIFLKNPMVYLITSIVGVVVFTGLTAYDTQRIKNLNIIGNEGTEEDAKEAIIGAVTLYLDFINLFLMLLRLTGKRN